MFCICRILCCWVYSTVFCSWSNKLLWIIYKMTSFNFIIMFIQHSFYQSGLLTPRRLHSQNGSTVNQQWKINSSEHSVQNSRDTIPTYQLPYTVWMNAHYVAKSMWTTFTPRNRGMRTRCPITFGHVILQYLVPFAIWQTIKLMGKSVVKLPCKLSLFQPSVL